MAMSLLATRVVLRLSLRISSPCTGGSYLEEFYPLTGTASIGSTNCPDGCVLVAKQADRGLFSSSGIAKGFVLMRCGLRVVLRLLEKDTKSAAEN